MRQTSSSKSKEPPVDRAAILAEIAKKLDGLKARGKALLADEIALEKAGVSPAAPDRRAADARHRALELLNGHAPAGMAAPSPGERLREIRLEREAVEAAVAILEQTDLQERIAAVAAITAASDRAWREIVRRRALAILELRAANAEAARFRRRVVAVAKQPVALRLDRQNGPIFGPPIVGDAAYEFLRDCVEAEIISKEEIDAAR